MSTPRLQLLLLIAVLVACYFYFDVGHLLTLETLKAKRASIASYYDANPLLAALIYALIYIAVTGLSLPGATLLTLAGGAMFGLFWGTLIISFASSIGATLAFLAARFLFRDAVNARFKDKLQTINDGLNQDGAFYLFSLRLVPLFPFFMINLAMGLTNISTRTFYWVSQVGMLAGTLVYVNAGTELGKVQSLSGILSPALVGAFVLLGIFPLLTKKIIQYFPRD